MKILKKTLKHTKVLTTGLGNDPTAIALGLLGLVLSLEKVFNFSLGVCKR